MRLKFLAQRYTSIIDYRRSSLSIGQRQTRPRPCLHGFWKRSRAKRVSCPNEVGTQPAFPDSYIFSPKKPPKVDHSCPDFCQSPGRPCLHEVEVLTTRDGHFRSSAEGRHGRGHASMDQRRAAERSECLVPTKLGHNPAAPDSYIFSPKWTIFNVRFSARFCQSPENHQKWRIASLAQGFCSYPSKPSYPVDSATLSKTFLSSRFGDIEWAYGY